MTMRFSNDALLCPRCGGDGLHHDCIEIFARAEDAQRLTHTVAETWGPHASRRSTHTLSPIRAHVATAC